jgi:hypothetical protein
MKEAGKNTAETFKYMITEVIKATEHLTSICSYGIVQYRTV